MPRPPPRPTLFPTRRSSDLLAPPHHRKRKPVGHRLAQYREVGPDAVALRRAAHREPEGGLDLVEDQHRSEEHTSELQSQFHLVCRLLLEKKKKKIQQ